MSPLSLLALWLACATWSGPRTPQEQPILIRHDRPDSAYVALGERYGSALAWLERRAEGTLVAPRWVLTAAHNVASLGPFDAPYVIIEHTRYEVEKIVVHPEWEGDWPDLLESHDLALLRLERPVGGVEPIPLYPHDDEHGREVIILGRGRTGTGLTGPVGDKGEVIRGATNRIDGVSATVLLTIFDRPDDGTDDHTELEGQGAAGDSGGPALIERDGRVFLAGVSSFGTAPDATASYGTLDGYIRVSAFRGWIERTIERNAPATQTWTTPYRYEGPHGYDATPIPPGRGAPLPATPLGAAATELLDALASGEEAALLRFNRRWGVPGGGDPEDFASRLHVGLQQAYGSPRVFGWSTSDGREIRLLFHSEVADTWRSLGLVLDGSGAVTLTRLYLKWESPPKPEIWR